MAAFLSSVTCCPSSGQAAFSAITSAAISVSHSNKTGYNSTALCDSLLVSGRRRYRSRRRRVITSSAIPFLVIVGFLAAQSNLNLNLWKKHLGHILDKVWDPADQMKTNVLADNNLVDPPNRII
jgi:hypothetical protein